MPTENRSNTEMVIVPREPCGEMLNAARNAPIPLVHLDSMSARQDLEFSARYKAAVARCPRPDPQPHPEPVAYIGAGNLFFRRRDAEERAGSMPITPLYTRPVQGEPVGEVVAFGKGLHEIAWSAGRVPGLGVKLYTHPAPADPGEVERLRAEIKSLRQHKTDYMDAAEETRKALLAQLAERDALLRDSSGKLIRMAAHLVSAPLFALLELQDEDKRMTRARVDDAVDSADSRLKDAAYELRRIADALSASAGPLQLDHEIPGTSFERLNMLANQGE